MQNRKKDVKPPNWQHLHWWVFGFAIIGLIAAFGTLLAVGKIGFPDDAMLSDIVPTAATVFGALTIGGVGIMQYRKQKFLEFQAQREDDSRTSELLQKAITHLESDNDYTRISAVYELKRLAEDSPRDKEHVARILISFIEKTNEAEGSVGAAAEYLSEIAKSHIESLQRSWRKVVIVYGAWDFLFSKRARKKSKAEIIVMFSLFGLIEITVLIVCLVNRELYLYPYLSLGTVLIFIILPYVGRQLRRPEEYILKILETLSRLSQQIEEILIIWHKLKADYFNFDNIQLRGAFLQKASLQYTSLENADLTGADLRYVDFTGADLEGTDLREADLRGAHLFSSNNLEKASIDDNTQFSPGVREKYFPNYKPTPNP